MRKRTFLVGALAAMAVMTSAGALWWNSVDLAGQHVADPATRPGQLGFMQNAVKEKRGRILAVVTSTGRAPNSDINAGFELTELARAYYIFKANGFDVDIASPQGGRPPVNIDEELFEADYAFLNDETAQTQIAETLKVSDIDAREYEAVYFVGGKGAMFDFPENPDVQRLVAEIYDLGGVVGAVCHGPAALIGTRMKSGEPLFQGKRLTAFTDEEEFFIISNAREVFPFLLEEKLRSTDVEYLEGPMYLDHTIIDGRLVTGQNPWSTWSVAEGMVRALGYTPIPREQTREEKAITILNAYRKMGLDAAKVAADKMPDFDKRTVLLHSAIDVMEGNFTDAFRIQQLVH